MSTIVSRTSFTGSYAEQIGPVLEGPGAKRNDEKIPSLLSLAIPSQKDVDSLEIPKVKTTKQNCLPKLDERQQEMLNKAKRYASEQNIVCAMVKNTFPLQGMTSDTYKCNAQRQQALSLMCRIYIGSVSFDLTEDVVKQAFIPFGPIRSMTMSIDLITQKHKGFAFLEYETAEAGELAVQQMMGTFMGGRNIKVGRPSNMPQAQPIIEEIKREAEPYYRLYVASVHPDLTEQDIKSVFEAFGPIVSCKLALIPMTNKHKGYGYIEYQTRQACDDAISSMNLFDLGGQLLRVGKCVTPPNISAALMGLPVLPPGLNGAKFTPEINNMMGSPAFGALPTVIPPPSIIDPNALSLIANSINSPSTPSGSKGDTPSQIRAEESRQTDDRNGRSSSPKRSTSSNFKVDKDTSSHIKGDTANYEKFIPAPSSLSGINLPPPPVLANIALATAQSIKTTNEIMGISQILPKQAAILSMLDSKTKPAQNFSDIDERLQEKRAKKLDDSEDVSISGRKARHMVMQKLMKKTESRILCLKNMVGPEDIDPTLEGEVTEECSKYGAVRGVFIHQEINEYANSSNPQQPYNPEIQNAENDDIIVKIFVEFAKHTDVLKAKEALNGRYFGGRTVIAEVYDQMAYNDNDYSL